ncbi:hypothetical protein PFISCL1PPCAC_7043, partial [Pristionchus fissidentatus]
TIVLIIFLPVHLRFAYILRTNNQVERTFRFFLHHINVINIFYSISQLSIHNTAWFGIANEFFLVRSLILMLNVTQTSVIPTSRGLFYFLIGFNQMTAVLLPFKHKQV